MCIGNNISSGNTHQYFLGGGMCSCGRERGRQTCRLGNRPTCQLCNKYGHYAIECWHNFDEYFEDVPPKLQGQASFIKQHKLHSR